jgi:UDP-glucose 4-epimerase
MAACSLRFSNAYGPNSLHKKSVVAAWLRAALAGRPVVIHGDGEQTRDFVFAGDLAAAVCAVIDAPEEDVSGELFQAGTGRETTINGLVEAIRGALGRPIEVVHEPGRAGDVRRNVSRVDKAARILGYRAAVALEDGLATTACWYEAALADPELAAIRPHAASGSE